MIRGLFGGLLAIVPARWLAAVIHVFAGAIEKSRKGFFTYHVRPKAAPASVRFTTSGTASRPIAFVLQGPVIVEDRFTLETVKLYRRNFPGVTLIVSTWTGTDERVVAELEAAGATVCLSETPRISGVANFNYQRVSTQAGLNRARQSGAEYVLKTRTDQRCYQPDLVQHLLTLLEVFPLNHKTEQTARLIAISFNSFKYRPYSVSDMFLFGKYEDVARVWDVPEDPRSGKPSHGSLLEWSRAEMAEVYLATNYLRKIGHEPRWTLRDSWEVFRDYFCIVDASAVDLYWPKYERFNEYRYRDYETERTNAEMSWSDWLNLYNADMRVVSVPEKIIQLNFGDPIPGEQTDQSMAGKSEW